MQSFEIESYLQLDEFRLEIQRRDQEVLAMAAKMKTLEEQHQVIYCCNWLLIRSVCVRTAFIFSAFFFLLYDRTINVTFPY